MFASKFIALAALLPAVLGSVYTTAPIATTSWAAGTQQTIQWQDSTDTPAAKDFGPAKVSIYVGNAKQQTPLQLISDSVDVSTVQSIVFTPDATIGPNSGDYFIRFESLSLMDATDKQYPALAFSSKFALTGMSGTFNATVQAQIDGASTAPIVGATGTGTATGAASTGAASTTGSGSASSTKAASSGASASASKSGSSSPAASATGGNASGALGRGVTAAGVLAAVAAAFVGLL